jgi:hypothetical protein
MEATALQCPAYDPDPDQPVNVVDGLFAIARAINNLAGAIHDPEWMGHDDRPFAPLRVDLSGVLAVMAEERSG